MHEDGHSADTILALTLDTVKARSSQAAALFRLLVYFYPPSIQKQIITAGLCEIETSFARPETYDRGVESTAAELKEMRIKAALARLTW